MREAPAPVKEYLSKVEHKHQYPLFAEVCLRGATTTSIIEGTCTHSDTVKDHNRIYV